MYMYSIPFHSYYIGFLHVHNYIYTLKNILGEGLETKVTSNYIRVTPGFNRGCVSNVGKI